MSQRLSAQVCVTQQKESHTGEIDINTNAWLILNQNENKLFRPKHLHIYSYKHV